MFIKSFFVASILLFCVITVCAFAAPQPIVYYTFDELDKVVKDASGKGNDGTPKGDLKLVDGGKVGKCYQFNGLNSYVDLARVIQDDFTMMAWIKTDQPGVQLGAQGYQGSGVFWSDVAGAANDFILAVLGTKLSFFCGNPDTSVNSDKDVVTGSWVHVAAVRSATDQKIGIYIDGKLEKIIDHANKNSLNAQPRLHIGGNTLDSRYYNGLIDEVRIFDVALIEKDIQGNLSLTAVDVDSKLSTTWGDLKAKF
jgi:hypothetical protein